MSNHLQCIFLILQDEIHEIFWVDGKMMGRLNLAAMQFQRLMNIVHLEGVLFGLHITKEAIKDISQSYI